MMTSVKKKLHFEGLCIDKYKRIVVRDENEIELTYTEFEILLLLAQNAGIVFSKEQIYDSVWKEPYFGDYNIVMSHIRNIRERQKITQASQYTYRRFGVSAIGLIKMGGNQTQIAAIIVHEQNENI